MKLYFSGFSLENEEELFNSYREKSDFTVSGFSYGSIKAFEYVLNTTKRVDKLQLFSPAYFNNKDKKYKRMQLMYFKKDANTYCDNFLKNSGFLEGKSSRYFNMGSYEELEALLNYQWCVDKLELILEKNIIIEVFLGGNDKIIDTNDALKFFRKFSEVYYIKNKGHIL